MVRYNMIYIVNINVQGSNVRGCIAKESFTYVCYINTQFGSYIGSLIVQTSPIDMLQYAHSMECVWESALF